MADSNRPLTEEERRFAEENHNIIYAFLKQKGCSADEYYDIAVFGYLNAVKNYTERPDLRKYAFTTIAYWSMWSAVTKVFEKEGRNPEILSFQHENEKGSEFAEAVADPAWNNFEDTVHGLELEPERYEIVDGGMLYKDDGWTYEGYPYGLARDPIMGKLNIEVKYTAGYILPNDGTRKCPVTLPADIEGLCLEMVQNAYGKLTNGGNAGLKSYAISDIRWEWLTETPQAWQEVIDQYRRGWV